MALMATLRSSSICYLEWLEKGRGWGWGRGTGTHREERGQGMPGPHKQQEASIQAARNQYPGTKGGGGDREG